jgi:hypothetical protein
MRTEAELRDYLAEHLHLIEKDLQLRAKEYRLENSLGTTGRVDILASDRFAATVVIELKKTDQSARQALHEVHKYVALLKRERGLSIAQLRCMVVSVEWGELLLPFSEFVRSTPWVVDGYRLILDDQGVPTGSEKVSPVEEPEPLRLCRYHDAYFFRDSGKRNSAIPILENVLQELHAPEHIILVFDTSPRVEGSCDHCLYVIPTVLEPTCRQSIRRMLSTLGWAADLDEDTPFVEEQLFFGEVRSRFAKVYDEAEIGYPEKLDMLLGSWKLTELRRYGRKLGAEDIFPADHIIRLAAGRDGTNAHRFELLATPERKLAWAEARTQADYCLTGTEFWRLGYRAYLDEIESETPSATVTAYIFNPCDLFMTLLRLAKGQAWASPRLQIVVSDLPGNVLRVVQGIVSWNGNPAEGLPAEYLPPEFPTLFDLYFATHIDGGPWSQEEYIAERHGISYDLVELDYERETSGRLCLEEGKLVRRGVQPEHLRTVPDFVESNPQYVSRLLEDFSSWAKFVPE